MWVVGSSVRFFGVVEVKGRPVCAPVQVALALHELAPAIVGHRIEGANGPRIFLGVKVGSSEVSDESGIGVGVGVCLVEQVDVVAAEALVQIIVD